MTIKDTLTHQVRLRSAYKILRGMFDRLDVKVSDNYSALYGRDDLLGVLMCMSDGNRFVASATASLGPAVAYSGADGADGWRVPSSSWVLKKLRDVDPVHMEEWCRDGTKRLLKAAKIKKMSRRGGMVAVDLTNIAYYGRSLKEGTVKANPKNGTSRFLVHAVAHSIGPVSYTHLTLPTKRIV